MPPESSFVVVPGTIPLVLVAPHGGRRDALRRPWASGPLRVNDLHTAALTSELAAATGAAALINRDVDRNDVDLNRIGAACERAPGFLARLGELINAALARHGRVTLLTVHGWNVIQPAVDVGLGCRPSPGRPLGVDGVAAVSPGFAATGVRALLDACAANGIVATVGARYPACGRENLLQLFTRRYREDARPLVRALAARAADVEAVQLELGIPLRWPGPWRDRLVAACATALPALLGSDDPGGENMRSAEHAPRAGQPARALQFVSPTLSGLARLDSSGGRLLLFPRTGGVLIFTGERTPGQESRGVGGLELEPTASGRLHLRYRGPFLRFPDTTPFLDLEEGFARADLVDGDVDLQLLHEDHLGDVGGTFGPITGSIAVAGWRTRLDGHGFTEGGASAGPWPRLRVAVRVDAERAVAVTIGCDPGAVSGFVRVRGRRLPIVSARATADSGGAMLERIALELDATEGHRFRFAARLVDRLPVVRTQGGPTVGLLFATVCPDGTTEPAGWCELAGI